EQVTLLDRIAYLVLVDADTAAFELGRATARPLLGVRDQERLHGGVGRDHRADVATLDDVVTGGDQRALLLEHRRAYLGVGGDRRAGARDPRVADRIADVAAVGDHPRVVVLAAVQLDVERRPEARKCR